MNLQTVVHVGLCLPQSCSNKDVYQLVDTVLNSDSFTTKYYLEHKFELVESKVLKLREDFYGSTIVNLFL